ncbi:MAG: cofactor-independent phosphoglycerate mutase [Lachnospiraceae bacterium]|nr:cofactor-independent phosphoglycerate mutase [Lachnospiraceae bacterium]
MKYIILLCDGMSDEPLEELGGKTPMEAACTPHMDALAKISELGLVETIPPGMLPGSDTANLSVLGYDPQKYYSGRSPLEALSIGVDMKDTDVSFRCNFVTLSEEQEKYEDKIMLDHSAGEISTEEAEVLLKAVQENLGSSGYDFYSGVGYRHLLIESMGQVLAMTPPHDILMQKIAEYLPTHVLFREMMQKSYDVLQQHPINVARRAKGLGAANSIWLWGAGTRPALTDFAEKFGKKGALTSAVDLLKGIAVGANLHNIAVAGATGGLDNDYQGQAKGAVQALLEKGYDFVYLHVEAPDEMSHHGSITKKIQAIEDIDEKVLPILLEELKKEDLRLLILPDHPTPVLLRTHTTDPVPYLLYDNRKKQVGAASFHEKTAKASGRLITKGHELILRLFYSDV